MKTSSRNIHPAEPRSIARDDAVRGAGAPGAARWLSRLFLACLVAVAIPSLAFAQGAGEEAPADFRGKVTLAYGLVFGLTIIFIALSYRRNAGMREEVDFLARRLDEIEKKGS